MGSEQHGVGRFAHLPARAEPDVAPLSLPCSCRRRVSSVPGRKRRRGRR